MAVLGRAVPDEAAWVRIQKWGQVDSRKGPNSKTTYWANLPRRALLLIQSVARRAGIFEWSVATMRA